MKIRIKAMNKILKRFFDILISLLFVCILFPLFLVIALSIKIEDGGPIFFKHERSGLKNQNFQMLKFRSMREGADKQGIPLTVINDVRVTNIGKFIRAYRIDEFPQLINVILGDMSIVGPRPESPKYTDYYNDHQKQIFNIIPGITDPGTIYFLFKESKIISGFDDPEDAYLKYVMPQRNNISIDYAEKANIYTDFIVILKTLITLVLQK